VLLLFQIKVNTDFTAIGCGYTIVLLGNIINLSFVQLVWCCWGCNQKEIMWMQTGDKVYTELGDCEMFCKAAIRRPKRRQNVLTIVMGKSLCD